MIKQITELNVFIASSMQLTETRGMIAEVLQEYNPISSTQIKTYRHENDGIYSITPGVGSQEKIDAEALSCDGFILYVGDYIGTYTIGEYVNIINKADRSHTFIFVVHNPDEKLPNPDPEKHVPWQKFYDEHMVSKADRVTYYELQTSGNDLREHLKKIRNEMLLKSLVPLSPDDIDYNLLLSSGQKAYRTQSDFYYYREIDKQLAQRRDEGFAPLTVVSGESLAGKTRALMNLFKDMESDVRIHFLRGSDTKAADTFLSINPNGQFFSNKRHFLFIDEIDNLLLSPDKTRPADAAVMRKFGELMSIANSGPAELHIVATTNINPDTLLNGLRMVPNSEHWLEKTDKLEVKPPAIKELIEVAKVLRSRNLIDNDNLKNLQAGMPIGALFVDLVKVRVSYNALAEHPDARLRKEYRTLFDAIKTIGIWKIHSRNDFDLLLQFINLTMKPGDTPWSADHLYGRLKELGTLASADMVTIEPEDIFDDPVTTYVFSVEDVIRKEVFRFDRQTSQRPESIDYTRAAWKAVLFLEKAAGDTILSDQERDDSDSIFFFRDLTKLITRIADLIGDTPEYTMLFKKVLEKFPLESVAGLHALTRTLANESVDWVDLWLSKCADFMLRSPGGHEQAVELYSRRPSEHLLAELLTYERETGFTPNSDHLLFDDEGKLRPEYYQALTLDLSREITNRLDFDEAIGWLVKHDFEYIIDHTIPKHIIDRIDRANEFQKYVAMTIPFVACKIRSVEDLKKLLGAIDEMNRGRIERGLSPLYDSEAHKFFMLINPMMWRDMADRFPSARLFEVFDMLADIDTGDPDPNVINPLRMRKTMALNCMLRPMPKPDLFSCSDRMGTMRDTYTLRYLLENSSDFAEAKGIFDSFMQSEIGKKMKASPMLLNPLLDKAMWAGDLVDAEESFRRFGFLKPGQSILDTDDFYTMGSLYNIRKLPFRQILEYVKYQRREGRTRPPKTLGPVINNAPDYASARMILFDEEGLEYITPTEREFLCQSPLIVSWYLSKASNAEEGADALGMLTRLTLQWESEGIIDETLGHTDGNIVSEFIRNRNIIPTYEDAIGYLEALKEKGVDLRGNIYVDRQLVRRFIGTYARTDYARTIREVNRLLLDHTDAPRREVMKNTKLRCNILDKNIKFWQEIDQVEEFPYIDSDNTWKLKTMPLKDFFLNMLRHRFAHAATLCNVLAAYGRKLSPKFRSAGEDTPRKDKATLLAEVQEIIDTAVESRTFVSHSSFISIRETFSRYGLRLAELSPDYSVITEVSTRLTLEPDKDKKISPEFAEKMIREHEELTGIPIHRSQAYYDAIITYYRMSGEKTVAELIDLIRQLPKGISFSQQMYHTLMKRIRNLEDVKLLDREYDGLPVLNRFTSLLSDEFKQINEREKRRILAYALGAADGEIHPDESLDPTLIVSLLSRYMGFNFDQILDIIERHGYKLNRHAYFQMIYRVETSDQYRRLEPHMPDGELHPDYMAALLNRFHDHDRNRTREELFSYFDNPETIRKWKQVYRLCNDKDFRFLTTKFNTFMGRVSGNLQRFIRELASTYN